MSEEVYRNYEQERNYGMNNVRGILYAVSFSLGAFLIFGGIGFGVSQALGA